ncbi:MAG: nucleotide exchange factor GrpE [Actinobacteria bacterium]|nr:nucleotide exchange factor GrpE [Actinomycetota bacterium]
MNERSESSAEEPRPAGPVPGSGSSSSQAAGEDPDPAPPARDTAEQDVERDLGVLLADAEAKRDEYLDIARRAQADFENYRKRMAQEVQGAALRGKADVARGVVPVLDDLERALQAAGLDPEGDSDDALAHGVLLVFRNLRETLGRSGVEVVDPTGEKFDPNFHEALSTVQVEGAEAGVVVEVMQKGYRFDGHLIRPAMVVVAA